MFRLVALVSVFYLFFVAMVSPAAGFSDGSPRVIWQASRVGQSASDLQVGPNGLIYLLGNKIVAIDDKGKKLLDVAGPSGSAKGRLVFDAHGSIFLPGNSLIQEVKLNGSKGWNFTVYQGSSSSDAKMTAGPGDLLYLPLQEGLYAVDTVGRYKWLMLQWDSVDGNRSKSVTGREILDCTGNSQAVFVVYGKNSDGYNLVAVNGEGKVLWRYWLGKIKSAYLAIGPDGRVYMTASPTSIDRMNNGKVYVFESNGDGTPLWSYSVRHNDLSAPTPSRHGLLYFCAGEKLFALNQTDGTEVWEQDLYKAKYRPAVDEVSRRLYLGTEDKRLLAVNPQGRLDWEKELDGNVSVQPLVVPGGYVYVATDAGSLYKILDEPVTEETEASPGE